MYSGFRFLHWQRLNPVIRASIHHYLPIIEMLTMVSSYALQRDQAVPSSLFSNRCDFHPWRNRSSWMLSLQAQAMACQEGRPEWNALQSTTWWGTDRVACHLQHHECWWLDRTFEHRALQSPDDDVRLDRGIWTFAYIFLGDHKVFGAHLHCVFFLAVRMTEYCDFWSHSLKANEYRSLDMKGTWDTLAIITA